MSDDVAAGPLGELRRINVRPGDLFVLNVHRPPSAEDADYLRDCWRTVAGDVPLLILGPGTELTAYRPVESSAEPAVTEQPSAELSWHYGPTDWDPDPGKRWHTDCPGGRGEVLVFEEGASCSDCGVDDDPGRRR